MRGLLLSRGRLVHIFDLVVVIILLFLDRVQMVLLLRQLDLDFTLATTPESAREAWQVCVSAAILIIFRTPGIVVNELGLFVLGKQISFVVLERGVKVVLRQQLVILNFDLLVNGIRLDQYRTVGPFLWELLVKVTINVSGGHSAFLDAFGNEFVFALVCQLLFFVFHLFDGLVDIAVVMT